MTIEQPSIDPADAGTTPSRPVSDDTAAPTLGHLALAHRPTAIADLDLGDRPAAFADLDTAIVAELKSIEES